MLVLRAAKKQDGASPGEQRDRSVLHFAYYASLPLAPERCHQPRYVHRLPHGAWDSQLPEEAQKGRRSHAAQLSLVLTRTSDFKARIPSAAKRGWQTARIRWVANPKAPETMGKVSPDFVFSITAAWP